MDWNQSAALQWVENADLELSALYEFFTTGPGEGPRWGDSAEEASSALKKILAEVHKALDDRATFKEEARAFLAPSLAPKLPLVSFLTNAPRFGRFVEALILSLEKGEERVPTPNPLGVYPEDLE